MSTTRLHWRIGLPFAAFVLAGSVLLVAWTWWSLESEDRAAFEKLAESNAKFIQHMRLPASERMARQLSEVLGVGVSFRTKDGFTPPLNEVLSPITVRQFEKVPSDGRFHLTGGWESVAVRLENETDLVLTKRLVILPKAFFHPRMLIAVGGFWFMALVLAWLVTRGLVRPLRHLAAKLPDIEKPERLDLPEAERNDEIGDVARAFIRTREALQTEREQRLSAERLAVLGRMTAALAHEIQNPVAAIKMHAQLMQNDLESAGVIANEAGRIEGLVNQWMFLSKPEPPAMSAVDVGSVLKSSLAAHRAQLDHAQVRAELTAQDGLLIQGDHRRLSQVFSNLIINAIQAMPRGGQLAIQAGRIESAIAVTFADTGKGFSQAALEHFAEFFFSEKEGGMGIGLSVANEIVKAHGGTLKGANGVEGGACVTIRLPP
jgi:signal transduction histidine kinase